MTHSLLEQHDPQWIQFEERPIKNGKLGLVHLNRDAHLNALSFGMIQALDRQLEIWQKDPNLLAVWVDSLSERAFCAGGDLRVIYNAVQNKLHPIEFFYHEYRLNYRIHNYPKPYIVYLNGLTMGGGVGISVHASHRIGTEKLAWSMPETGIGFFPDVGSTYILSRCPGKTGCYLGLTGASINAGEAFDIGLLECVLPSNLSKEMLLEQLSDLNFKAEQADKVITVWLQKLHDQALKNACASDLKNHRVSIDKYFSHHTMEEILDAMKRDISPWITQVKDILLQRSPSALKITLIALKKALHLSIEDCLLMEYRLTDHALKSRDFMEGIRAKIIEKDRSPIWIPNRLEEVYAEKIHTYFNHDFDLNLNNLI